MVNKVQEIVDGASHSDFEGVTSNNLVELTGPWHSGSAVRALTGMRGTVRTRELVLNVPQHLGSRFCRSKDAQHEVSGRMAQVHVCARQECLLGGSKSGKTSGLRGSQGLPLSGILSLVLVGAVYLDKKARTTVNLLDT